MLKFWQPVREFLPIAAVILLCLVVVPVLQYGNDGEASTTPLATATPPTETATPAKPQEKMAASKPQENSAIDPEATNSPVSYFKKAFYFEEDEQDATSDSSAAMIAVKAIIATLLSTII